MQKVAAYLLERRDGVSTPEEREFEAGRLRGVAMTWLGTKGAKQTEDHGQFAPLRGQDGAFQVERASDGVRSWWMLTLTETSPEGICFRTAISVTTDVHVMVYVSLEAGLDHSRVGSLDVEPHCPGVVRHLLSMDGIWYHGRSRVMDLQRVDGYHAGQSLAEEIAFADRSIPVVVVSEDKFGRLALPNLDQRIAFDLAGLANVCRLDGDAAWAISDALGLTFACYGGSVRLYWPGWGRRAPGRAHPLWRATQLALPTDGSISPRDRLRRALRMRVFAGSAFGVVRPKVIDSIRDAHQHAVFEDKRNQATSAAEYKELAEDYANANDELRATNRAQADKIADFQTAVANLETRLRYAEETNAARPEDPVREISPALEAPEEARAPQRGETRFYKKIHDTGAFDVMREVADCGCNKWQEAHRADKAIKGIERRSGSREWKSIQRCGKCTGGGMWKVRW